MLPLAAADFALGQWRAGGELPDYAAVDGVAPGRHAAAMAMAASPGRGG